MKLPPPTRDEFTGAGKMLYRPVRGNPPFYAHNLYEKKTHGLNLHQMRRLYRMVSAGNQKAITYARNVLGIPFSESPSQVKAVVLHHVRDLAEELMDDEANVRRLIWIAAGDMRDNPELMEEVE